MRAALIYIIVQKSLSDYFLIRGGFACRKSECDALDVIHSRKIGGIRLG